MIGEVPRRLVGAALVASLVLGGVRTAAAQPKDKVAAEAAFAEGQRHYGAGDYVVAAEKFEAAYALDPDPAYLFNLAQAYRFGHACAKAAAAYRRFLAAVPAPPNLTKVQGYIAQAEACAASQPTLPAPPLLDPPRVEPPRLEPPHVEPPRPTPPPRPARPAHPGRPQRLIGLGAIAVGALSAGAGVWFTTKVSGYEDDRAALCPGASASQPCGWDGTRAAREAELSSLGTAASRNAVLGYGIGGALIVGGAVLYVLGRGAEHASPAVSISSTPGGALAVGGFAF